MITELALRIILVQVFYFFTDLSNYGIIKVIESYIHNGFEVEKALAKVRTNNEGYYISRW